MLLIASKTLLTGIMMVSVGALIGWVTNYLAIKLLFHPRNPIDFKLFVVHGIFPKNKKKMAANLGTVIQKDLVSFDDIKKKLADPKAIHTMSEEVSFHVENAIRERLHATKLGEAIIPEGIIKTLHQIIVSDIETTLPKMIDQYVDTLEEKINIRKIVYEKIQDFSDEKLEDLILAIVSKEFRFIEIVGAVLGGVIGVIQFFITQIM